MFPFFKVAFDFSVTKSFLEHPDFLGKAVVLFGERRQDHRKMQEKDEKEHEEKWRRDPLGALIWAFIIIWAGVVH